MNSKDKEKRKQKKLVRKTRSDKLRRKQRIVRTAAPSKQVVSILSRQMLNEAEEKENRRRERSDYLEPFIDGEDNEN